MDERGNADATGRVSAISAQQAQNAQGTQAQYVELPLWLAEGDKHFVVILGEIVIKSWGICPKLAEKWTTIFRGTRTLFEFFSSTSPCLLLAHQQTNLHASNG